MRKPLLGQLDSLAAAAVPRCRDAAAPSPDLQPFAPRSRPPASFRAPCVAEQGGKTDGGAKKGERGGGGASTFGLPIRDVPTRDFMSRH